MINKIEKNITPKVAVIVVNYNSETLLQTCLLALEQQIFKPSKVIVIDNGSDLPFDEKTLNKYSFVEFVFLPKNIGFAAANNKGIHHAANCDWIALLNPDAFPEPNWLLNLVAAAAENKEFSAFASHLISAEDPERLDGTGDVYHVSGRPWRRDHGKKMLVQRQVEEVFAPCAAAAMYSRDALLEVGGFDEQYFCYVEDVDLGFRLRLANHRCLYVPDASVFHIGSAITGRKSDFFVYHGQRNLVWTYVKNMPGILFWIYLPHHIVLNLLSLIFFALRGQFKVALKAKWDAVCRLPIIFQHRKYIQKTRKISPWKIRQVMAKGLPFRK